MTSSNSFKTSTIVFVSDANEKQGNIKERIKKIIVVFIFSITGFSANIKKYLFP
jgi:hypothetical protein